MRGGSPLLGIVFGAGASHDSSPLFPAAPDAPAPPGFRRPPLTNELFAPHEEQRRAMLAYEEIGGLVELVAPACAEGNIGFEAMMDRLWAASEEVSDSRRRRSIQFMALRFYLRDLISAIEDRWVELQGGRSTYTALLEQVEDWRARTGGRVLLVTFNYDTLLDRAVRVVVSHYDERSRLAGGLNPAPYALIKAHGSVSLWRDSELKRTAHGDLDPADPHLYRVVLASSQQLIAEQGFRQYGGRWLSHVGPNCYIRRLDDPIPLGLREDDRIAFPSIAVPAATKLTFELNHHDLALLRDWMADIDGLLVIGWAGKDKHFQDLVRDAMAKAAVFRVGIPKLMVVDVPAHAERIGRELAYTMGFNPSSVPTATDVRTSTVGFSRCIASRAVVDWIAEAMPSPC